MAGYVELEVIRQESDFDRACDEAVRRGVTMLGIDEDGHGGDFVRSRDSVEVRFLGYVCNVSMVGREHCYRFCASVVRGEEES
jgi:hypothetical protein